MATAPGPSLVGEETGTLFSFDFDDGVVPPIFSEGAVVAGSACGGSHHCLVGTIKPEYYDTMAIVMRHDPERSLFRYTGRLTLSFDYWLGRDADDYVIVTLWDHEKATPYYYNIFNHSTREVWTHVDIPLSDLAPRNTGDPPLDRGDGFCKLAIRGGRVGGKPFYVDNFKVVRR